MIAGIPDSMQKLMYKGLLQDSQTLSSSGITKGSKIMLVGSTLNDVLAVSSVSKQVSGWQIMKTVWFIVFVGCCRNGKNYNCERTTV